jgi:hypothetical protein
LEATSSAIAAARYVVSESVNSRAMVSSLSEIEWGWIVCAAIFSWIETKARQAVYEGRAYDETIQAMPGEPAPWEAGAVETILPALGNIDGTRLGKAHRANGRKSKSSLCVALIHKLTDQALAHRDEGAKDVVHAIENRACGAGTQRSERRAVDGPREGSLMTISRSSATSCSTSTATTWHRPTSMRRSMPCSIAAALIEEREAKRTLSRARPASARSVCSKVQYDWQCDSVHPARTKRIFERGHASEEKIARLFALAGFRMERGSCRLQGSPQSDGLFKAAHRMESDSNRPCDRRVDATRACGSTRRISASGWRKLEKDGHAHGLSAIISTKCQLYHGLFRDLDENPALFTADQRR